MSPEAALALAKEYIRLHNAAAAEYKRAFASVGAAMWVNDQARPIKSANAAWIAKQLVHSRVGYEDATPLPLTVLDKYPEVRADKKKLAKLVGELRTINRKYNSKWRAELKGALSMSKTPALKTTVDENYLRRIKPHKDLKKLLATVSKATGWRFKLGTQTMTRAQLVSKDGVIECRLTDNGWVAQAVGPAPKPVEKVAASHRRLRLANRLDRGAFRNLKAPGPAISGLLRLVRAKLPGGYRTESKKLGQYEFLIEILDANSGKVVGRLDVSWVKRPGTKKGDWTVVNTKIT